MITRLVRIAVRWPVQVLAVWAVGVAVLAAIGLPNVQSKLLPADLFIPGTGSYQWEQLKAPNYGLSIAAAIEGPAADINAQGPVLEQALALRPLTRVQSPFSPGAGAAARILRPSPTEAVYALDVRLAPGQNSSTVVPPPRGWAGARYVTDDVSTLPATLTFHGSGIALLGTLGEQCCEPGHARVLIDGHETFDETGIWQNKSSAGRAFGDTVLFAWRWSASGEHRVTLLPAERNAKEGGAFVDVTSELVIP